MLNNQTVAFLGAGSMAESMISGLVETGLIPSKQIIVTNKQNKQRLKQMETIYQVKTVSMGELPYEQIDIFILAMKPTGAGETLAHLKDLLRPNQLVLSVLAGISTDFMEQRLHDGQKVIRVMPNTSSMIQESATAMSLGHYCQEADKEIAKQILQTMGKVYVIPEEKMDIFTGMAGSGPAYFYYLMEYMEQVGEMNGLDKKMARDIAAQTIYGAAKMVLNQNESPESLRNKVTSPNGTTAKGLEALAAYQGGEAIKQAITHAAAHSKELSESFVRELAPS